MINGKKYITVNTDAGLKGDIGAYAFYIRDDDRTRTGSGKFKKTPENSTDAEIMAIINALHFLIDKYDFTGVDEIVVNTDCTAAIHHLKTGSLKPNLSSIYVEIKNKITCKLKFKHVKGHTSGKKPRNWVNNWCDSAVRKHYKS